MSTDPKIYFTRQVIWNYKGWLFEFSENKPFGPWPLRKDWSHRKRAGRKFYKMFEEFNSLPPEVKSSYRVKS